MTTNIANGVPRGGGTPGQASFDTFTHLVIEDFLRKKNMNNTLRQFKEEWSETRPSEDDAILSWYEISMKLRLPDIVGINEDNANSTVLENISLALMRESSLRARRGIEIITEGLATLPKVKPLPNITTSSSAVGLLDTGTAGIAGNIGINDLDNGMNATEKSNFYNGGNDNTNSVTEGSINSKEGSKSTGTGTGTSGPLHKKSVVTPAVAAAMEQKAKKEQARLKAEEKRLKAIVEEK